jgi:hypothetical protein
MPWPKLDYDTQLGGYRVDLMEDQLRGDEVNPPRLKPWAVPACRVYVQNLGMVRARRRSSQRGRTELGKSYHCSAAAHHLEHDCIATCQTRGRPP